MLITTENEIMNLMPTARWKRVGQLMGYLEEEERVALEPLLGTALYGFLLAEYERLTAKYVDITATGVRPTGKAKADPGLPYADVTERIEYINAGGAYRGHDKVSDSWTEDVPETDMQTIRLIRICQQIEWYKMISHKSGLLTVSFNEGGGMNMVSADGYDPADEKRMERVVKDAWMSAGRAVDSLLLFLETDAKGKRLFAEKWEEADAFYLHKDLLFQTARVLNEYLDIKGERMAYVSLVRDIRFCQNTYLKPRVGAKLLKAVVDWSNAGEKTAAGDGAGSPDFSDLLDLLRTALAFYVEARRTDLPPVKEKMARRDSMTDANQAMASACAYIEENLESLGDAAVGTPIYNAVRARREQEEADAACASRAEERRRRESCLQARKKMFTAFPMTHLEPELK